MPINDLLQLPGSLFLGHETYDDLVGLESRNVGADIRNQNFFVVGGDGTKGFHSGVSDDFGSTDGKQHYIIGVATSGNAAHGIYCSNGPVISVYGNNTVVGGMRATQSGNSFTYQSSAEAYAADGYNWIPFGEGDRVYGPTSTSNHIIGYLRDNGGGAYATFYGTNTIHGQIVKDPAASNAIFACGVLLLPGGGQTLTAGSYTLKNLPAGAITLTAGCVASCVSVDKSYNSIPSGKCIGGGYTEINGGSLKVTSSGVFEARGGGSIFSQTQKIPAGKYAWPLRYKSGTCDLGISTSGGKVRTLFGGAAVGRQITDMGRLRIYDNKLIYYNNLVASTGKKEDLQSYWMDKGPYGGWYLFDPGYWSYDAIGVPKSLHAKYLDNLPIGNRHSEIGNDI